MSRWRLGCTSTSKAWEYRRVKQGCDRVRCRHSFRRCINSNRCRSLWTRRRRRVRLLPMGADGANEAGTMSIAHCFCNAEWCSGGSAHYSGRPLRLRLCSEFSLKARYLAPCGGIFTDCPPDIHTLFACTEFLFNIAVTQPSKKEINRCGPCKLMPTTYRNLLFMPCRSGKARWRTENGSEADLRPVGVKPNTEDPHNRDTGFGRMAAERCEFVPSERGVVLRPAFGRKYELVATRR